MRGRIDTTKNMGGIISSGKPTKMAMTFVTDSIARDKVVIFSKTYCPYCTMAKEQFNKINQAFTAIELESRDDAADIQAVLGELTGATTVPRVFINGKFVGGGTDIKKLNETGKLQALVQ